jgi:hypothetical protein
VNFEPVRDDPKARETSTSIATRQVGANLLAQVANTATTPLTVPVTLKPGNYRLQVCADSNNAVPESSESNDCTESSVVSQVQ